MNDPSIKLDALLKRCYEYIGQHHSDPAFTHLSTKATPTTELHDSQEKRKRWKRREYRPKAKVSLAEGVRFYTNVLLYGESDDPDDTLPVKEPRALVSVPGWKLKEWKHKRHAGPTIEDFSLELDNDKGLWTPWNQAAATVFTTHFITLPGHQNYRRAIVVKAFRGHLFQVRRDFRAQGRDMTIDERDTETRQRRLACRKQVHSLISCSLNTHMLIGATHSSYLTVGWKFLL